MRENLHIQIMCLYVCIYFNEYVYVTYSFIFRQLHVCVCVCVSVGVITVITTVLPYSEKPNIGAASSFGDLQSRGSPKKTLLIRG